MYWTADLNFVEDKTEWNGSITFEVAKKDDKTEVLFTHVGLFPEYECYNSCSNAWGFDINSSLRKLIAKGKGQSNKKKKGKLHQKEKVRVRSDLSIIFLLENTCMIPLGTDVGYRWMRGGNHRCSLTECSGIPSFSYPLCLYHHIEKTQAPMNIPIIPSPRDSKLRPLK